jgi:nicotinamide-nucleotide adenylyltransferase
MKALFIGRFQPFHKGHLKVIQEFTNKYEEVIIGIGSSQYSNSNDNPFSSSDRIKMISESLKDKNIINYRIELIPDIHNPPKWVDHVLSIVSDFDIVITNNSFTKKLFEEKGFTVLNPPLYDKKYFSGREIRRRISKNEPWEDLVPNRVIEIIKENTMKK